MTDDRYIGVSLTNGKNRYFVRFN